MAALKIAYFINQYPKVSHSFIRREILAIERGGFEVQRIALRGWSEPLPDVIDQQERERTRYVLRDGTLALLPPTLRALLRSPRAFFAALRVAMRMSKDSDRSLAYHLVYLAEACRLLAWLREFGALRVHAHFGTNSTEVTMLARVLGGPPYSFTVHGPEEFERPMHLDEKIGRANFVVAISSFGRSQLYLRSKYEDWPKINIVHCGLEPEFYESAAADSPPGAPRFVCVGRLCEAKGQLLLIDAFALLDRKGVEFELVLAGDGPMRAEIERRIAAHGLAAKVRITGWISSARVREEILAARALVLPSFAEGLPVVIMESLALRRPVLTTFVAGIPELVRAGENGWLFPAGSVQAIAEAVEDCLATPPERMAAMGESGRKSVGMRHAIDTEAGKLADLMRSAEPALSS